jgi:hypothetical protein
MGTQETVAARARTLSVWQRADAIRALLDTPSPPEDRAQAPMVVAGVDHACETQRLRAQRGFVRRDRQDRANLLVGLEVERDCGAAKQVGFQSPDVASARFQLERRGDKVGTVLRAFAAPAEYVGERGPCRVLNVAKRRAAGRHGGVEPAYCQWKVGAHCGISSAPGYASRNAPTTRSDHLS